MIPIDGTHGNFGANINTCVDDALKAKNDGINADNNENDANDDGQKSLLSAVDLNKPDLLRLLIKKGSNVNTPGLYGETPLMRSVYNRDPACLVLLLASGADINAVNHKGQNALSIAFRLKSYGGICILAMFGAKFDAEQTNKIKEHAKKNKNSKFVEITEAIKVTSLQQLLRKQIYQQSTSVCRNKYPKAINALIKGGKLPERLRSFMLFEDDVVMITNTFKPCWEYEDS